MWPGYRYPDITSQRHCGYQQTQARLPSLCALVLGHMPAFNTAPRLTWDCELREDERIGVEVSSMQGAVRHDNSMRARRVHGRVFSEPKQWTPEKRSQVSWSGCRSEGQEVRILSPHCLGWPACFGVSRMAWNSYTPGHPSVRRGLLTLFLPLNSCGSWAKLHSHSDLQNLHLSNELSIGYQIFTFPFWLFLAVIPVSFNNLPSRGRCKNFMMEVGIGSSPC